MSGRIRTIKPELLEDEKAARLDDHSWRLFVSLWTLADDYGNMRGAVEWIHGQVFWTSPETLEHTRESLARLAGASLVTLYHVSGQQYLAITNWARHQRVDKPGKPRVPGPKQADFTEENENSRDSPDTLATSQKFPEPRARGQDPDPDPDLRTMDHGVCGQTPHAIEGTEDSDPWGLTPTRDSKPTPKRKREPKRARQLPDDWQPNEGHHSLAKDLRVTIGDELPKFCDHHRAKGSTFKDWDAAFRTWLRNAQRFAQRPVGAARPRSAAPIPRRNSNA